MKILFAGTPAFAVTHLAQLAGSGHDIVGVITQPDRPGKRGKKLIPGPVKVEAERQGLPVIQPERLKSADLDAFGQVDTMIVVAYGQILRGPVLRFPQLGCINVHASLLPRWRGAAPIQRSILAGDTQTGVCIMRMDKGLDTGPVIAQANEPIRHNDTAGSLSKRLAESGSRLLVETLADIEANGITSTPQVEDGVTYAYKIDKTEALVNWDESAQVIDRMIRAFNPDPVAFTLCGDSRIKIWQASAISSDSQHAPGTILEMTRQGIRVACGAGTLDIQRIQLPVGKGSILTPNDLLNSRQTLVKPLDVLGS